MFYTIWIESWNILQWTKLSLNHCNQLLYNFWLERDIVHCLSGTNPVHYATQSFSMIGLRGVFKHTGIFSIGTHICTLVRAVRAIRKVVNHAVIYFLLILSFILLFNVSVFKCNHPTSSSSPQGSAGAFPSSLSSLSIKAPCTFVSLSDPDK